MTIHAKDSLRGARITQILDFSFAVPTFEAIGTECLVSGQDCEVFDLVVAVTTTVCAIVAYQGAIAEQEEVGVRVEESATGVAAKAVDVPSVSG